jgi:hypothetical protein
MDFPSQTATGTLDLALFPGFENPRWVAFVSGSEAAAEVIIDIKPNSDPSSFGCKARGVIPVAVLGSSTFDATGIDANSVRFGKTGDEADAAEAHQKGNQARRHVEDVNADAFLDMVFHFRFEATGFGCSDIPQGSKSVDLEGILTGTADGTDFEATDILRLVGR